MTSLHRPLDVVLRLADRLDVALPTEPLDAYTDLQQEHADLGERILPAEQHDLESRARLLFLDHATDLHAAFEPAYTDAAHQLHDLVPLHTAELPAAADHPSAVADAIALLWKHLGANGAPFPNDPRYSLLTIADPTPSQWLDLYPDNVTPGRGTPKLRPWQAVAAGLTLSFATLDTYRTRRETIEEHVAEHWRRIDRESSKRPAPRPAREAIGL